MISGGNTVSIRITNGRIFKASSLRRAIVAISYKSPDSVTLAVITSLTGIKLTPVIMMIIIIIIIIVIIHIM